MGSVTEVDLPNLRDSIARFNREIQLRESVASCSNTQLLRALVLGRVILRGATASLASSVVFFLTLSSISNHLVLARSPVLLTPNNMTG